MKITEIVNGDSELIGINSAPESGSNLDTVAKGTTDDNIKIAHQPYRYDMMARFGFLGMPFYESVDNDDILNEIDEKVYEFVSESMKFYYKNPDKLKTNYRNIHNKKLNEIPKNINKYVVNISDGVLDVVENYLRKCFNKNKISESTVVEDKVILNKNEDEITKKSDYNDIKDKNLNKISDLISRKLDKNDIDKLIRLLERK